MRSVAWPSACVPLRLARRARARRGGSCHAARRPARARSRPRRSCSRRSRCGRVLGNRGLGQRHRDTIADMEPLDNPVWHALTGPPRPIRRGRRAGAALPARRRAVRGASPTMPTRGVECAREPGRPGGRVAHVPARQRRQPPADWEVLFRRPASKWSRPNRSVRPTTRSSSSDADDVPEMLALVADRARALLRADDELGVYLGLRNARGLVAMAGERMRGPGFARSARCAPTTARRQGLATPSCERSPRPSRRAATLRCCTLSPTTPR